MYDDAVIATRVHVIKEVGDGAGGDIIEQLQGKIAQRRTEIDYRSGCGGASRSHRQGDTKAEHQATKKQLELVRCIAAIHKFTWDTVGAESGLNSKLH
jgi:hypothetical protein